MADRTEHQYEDIIHLPHHQSAKRPHMSNYDRAAQFSPFAALTGYDAAVKESARLTEDKLELDDDTRAELDEKLQIILKNISSNPKVTVTYFRPDEKKNGGTYVTVTGCVKKIDTYRHELVMTDKSAIPTKQISKMESDLFRGLSMLLP